jgi:hypothetical protein
VMQGAKLCCHCIWRIWGLGKTRGYFNLMWCHMIGFWWCRELIHAEIAIWLCKITKKRSYIHSCLHDRLLGVDVSLLSLDSFGSLYM